jgi:hypothetical protein
LGKGNMSLSTFIERKHLLAMLICAFPDKIKMGTYVRMFTFEVLQIGTAFAYLLEWTSTDVYVSVAILLALLKLSVIYTEHLWWGEKLESLCSIMFIP